MIKSVHFIVVIFYALILFIFPERSFSLEACKWNNKKGNPCTTVTKTTNTSSYNSSRTLSVEAFLKNGDTGNLAYQWQVSGADIAGATSKDYTLNEYEKILGQYSDRKETPSLN